MVHKGGPVAFCEQHYVRASGLPVGASAVFFMLYL